MDKISFPSNRLEALAYLYVQSQNLTGLSPTEIQTMYFEAYYEMREDFRSKQSSGWFTYLEAKMQSHE